MNVDVTPVGQAPGAGVRRRRGWVRILLGLLAILAGVVATGMGIVDAVRERDRIDDEAVARGVVSADVQPPSVEFTATPEQRRFSVYVVFASSLTDSTVQDLTVRDTDCAVRTADGELTRFTGARQGTAVTIGKAASIGTFTSAPGRVQVRCAYGSSTRSSFRRRPDRIEYVVTKGGVSSFASGVGLIVGGVFGAVAGILLLIWGARKR